MFKHKPEKLKYLITVKTLDETHRNIIEKFNFQKRNLDNLKSQAQKLKNKLINIKDLNLKVKIRDEIENIDENIRDIENQKSLLDYYDKVDEPLMNYYDILDKNLGSSAIGYIIESNKTSDNILDKLNQNAKSKRKIKKITKKRFRSNGKNLEKPTNILNFFVKESNESVECDDNNNNNNRAFLLSDYLRRIGEEDKKVNDEELWCSTCNMEKSFFQSDGMIICTNCGEAEPIIIESDMPSYKDTIIEKPSYPYRRSNHFIERLNQAQAQEVTDISDEVYEKIYLELKKNRINDFSNTSIAQIKAILKKLRLNDFYEHTSFIWSRITKNPVKKFSREEIEKLTEMFYQIQDPFDLFCPEDRINFLSYSYFMNKFCQLLELDDMLEYYPLLKSRDKLRAQDDIWKKICHNLKWQFIPSI